MSIRRYLVLILLSIITLVTFISAIQGYKASMIKAADLFDASLVSIAQTLIIIDAKKPLKPVMNSGDIAFQLWDNDRLFIKSNNAPDDIITANKKGFNEENFLGQRWRTFTLVTQPNRRVIVAQPINKRFELAEEVILSAVTPIIIALPLLTLLILLTINRGLKPITSLTKELTQKKAKDLSLLPTKNQTKELMPVITTLNQLFERLSESFERERNFASDAAHELRTPLSVLKLNVHNLQYLIEDKNSLKQLEQSVDRMAHVVEQILILNRTNPERISIDSEHLDLPLLLRNAISELYPEISKREQNIVLNCEELMLMGNKFSIQVLLQNLISNASKYTPDKGNIIVTAYRDGKYITVIVEDSGPGINPSEYERVFDRFYRVGGDTHNSTIIGCGLGLGIVKHIVLLHHAKIILSKSEKLLGLKVIVTFPLEQRIESGKYE